jgi:hypothetical protein
MLACRVKTPIGKFVSRFGVSENVRTVMSQLGHERRIARNRSMSALHLITTKSQS